MERDLSTPAVLEVRVRELDGREVAVERDEGAGCVRAWHFPTGLRVREDVGLGWGVAEARARWRLARNVALTRAMED